MKLLSHLLVRTTSVLLAAYILPSVSVETLTAAFAVSILLGVLNAFFKPLLVLLTLPINLLTLGLFSFVINTFLVLVTDYAVVGFDVPDILSAFLFSIIVSLTTTFLNTLTTS